MISSIGETPEQRKMTFCNATDYQKDKYAMEMKEWRKRYPLAAGVMESTHKLSTDEFNELLAMQKEANQTTR